MAAAEIVDHRADHDNQEQHCAGDDGVVFVAALNADPNNLLRLSRLDPNWDWSRTAIISREWRSLEPVRSYAEALGIPIEMANESLPNVWRSRETQAFIAELRREPARLLGVADLSEILGRQVQNRWTGLIAEGIDVLAREVADSPMTVPDLIEWFAEWTHDTRGEQRGLLLLTAHRAKGLEFDDVVILDGDWEKPSRGEDFDAPRRLFYVAMTRARRSLAVMTSGAHPYLQASQEAVLRRNVASVASHLPDHTYRYHVPDMRQVDLSFAGRLSAGSPALQAIAAAKVGDPVSLVSSGGAWLLQNARRQTIGRMSAAFKPPEGHAFLRGEIGAIVRWRKTDSKEEYRAKIQREEWEAVLPELVFGDLSSANVPASLP